MWLRYIWGFPARHFGGNPQKYGWFISGKIPSFEMDDEIGGTPILGNLHMSKCDWFISIIINTDESVSMMVIISHCQSLYTNHEWYHHIVPFGEFMDVSEHYGNSIHESLVYHHDLDYRNPLFIHVYTLVDDHSSLWSVDHKNHVEHND